MYAFEKSYTLSPHDAATMSAPLKIKHVGRLSA
jgi:hypothetical protein